MPKTAYYAHSQWTYDTLVEAKDIRMIENLGYKVFNPNDPDLEEFWELKGMDLFDELMDRYNFDVCFIRPQSDGTISAGVGYEAMKFFELRKPVLEIPAPILPRTLTPEATRELYRWHGLRKMAEKDNR